MTVWKGKAIQSMTDAEIEQELAVIEAQYNETIRRHQDPKYLKKFENRTPPPINPIFMEILEAMRIEANKRKVPQ